MGIGGHPKRLRGSPAERLRPHGSASTEGGDAGGRLVLLDGHQLACHRLKVGGSVGIPFPSLPLPLVVEPKGEQDPATHSSRRRLQHELHALCNEISLPGSLALDIRGTDSARALRVRVHGALQPYPPDLMRRVWIAVAPSHLHFAAASAPNDSQPRFPDTWLIELAGGRTFVPPTREVVIHFLARMVAEVIRRKPGCLLGPAQVLVYAGQTIAARPEFVVQALKAMLDLGLSMADKEPVLSILDDSARMSLSLTDALEVAYARQRLRQVELRIVPQYFQAITGLPLKMPIAVNTSSLEQTVQQPFRRLNEELSSDLGLSLPPLLWVPEEN